MKTKPVLAIFLFLAGVVLLWSQIPVAASPAQQGTYPSPTPGPDGRIIYIVKAGETCTQISLMYGVSVEYIRTTNLLDENCTLREGQRLMIGVGGPSIRLPNPQPGCHGDGGDPHCHSRERLVRAQVCVLVYNDANGDALRQATEAAIAGAAISLTSPDGNYSQTLTSVINPDATAYQGMCFANVPPGKYSVSAAAPDGYNPTINLTTNVDVSPGDVASVDFGAQPKAVAVQQPHPPGLFHLCWEWSARPFYWWGLGWERIPGECSGRNSRTSGRTSASCLFPVLFKQFPQLVDRIGAFFDHSIRMQVLGREGLKALCGPEIGCHHVNGHPGPLFFRAGSLENLSPADVRQAGVEQEHGRDGLAFQPLQRLFSIIDPLHFKTGHFRNHAV